MGATTQTKEQIVATAIREISHIATLPEITLKIIELVEDPKSTAQDLNKVISNDPALCSRILKVVNSSFYGLPGQIGSINRAIVLLGLNAVKNIAIAASLAKLFRGGELTRNFSARDLWTHSTRVAAVSKLIADKLKVGLSDEAFLAGLIHDIGIMVEMQFDRNKLIEVFEKFQPGSGPTLLELEEASFGATHQDFGAGLCTKWKFPQSFTHVTGFHHRPMDLPADSRTLTGIIYVADRLCAEQENAGFTMDIGSTNIDPAVLEAIKLNPTLMEQVRAAMPEVIASAGQVFG